LLWILGAAVRAGPVEEVGKLLICEVSFEGMVMNGETRLTKW